MLDFYSINHAILQKTLNGHLTHFQIEKQQNLSNTFRVNML